MKANAPEKIYLTPLECMAASCQPQKDNAVEYTRTDAFVQKAAEWLDKTLRDTDFYENEIELFIKEFKKAMKL